MHAPYMYTANGLPRPVLTSQVNEQ
jgi:hypothetical protein